MCPRRRPGVIDPNQMLLRYIYRNAVRRIVESNPSGLNIKQIAERLPEARTEIVNEIISRPPPVPVQWHIENLPQVGKSRKTVRKYLNELMKSTIVKKVGILYYPNKPTSSARFKDLIDTLLTSDNHQDWTFAPDVAIYRTYIDPREYRNRIDDFFNSHIPRFANSLYFLDQIVEDAIGSGQLSERVLIPTKKSINMQLLKEGWSRYFGATKLFILAYAVSPPELLKFLETEEGSKLAEEILADRWDDILRGAERKRRLLERTARTIQLRKGGKKA